MHAKNRVVVSKIWITGYWFWLWSRLSYIATASNQRRIVEIQLLASVGWKCGCQPFSRRCSLNVTLPKGERFVWHVCLRNPFPQFLFGFRSLQSLPEAWGSWERQHAASALHLTSLMQRSKGFGHGVVVSKICYVIYSDCVQDLDYRILIVLSVVTRGCCKPMNNCRDWAFRNIGLEEWLPAFQLLIFEYTSINAEKRCSKCVSRESMPFVISKPPLPTRSLRSLGAAVRSTSSAFLLHHAHPFVAAAEKRPVSCREAEGLVTELWSPRIVAILIVPLWLLQRKVLASVGWKQGCQPFSCWCSLNVTEKRCGAC